MENTVFLEDLKLNRDNKDSIKEISSWLACNYKLRLKGFINSGEDLVGVCESNLSQYLYDVEDITSKINAIWG